MKMRPPAIPLLNIDPYFSVWTKQGLDQQTVHWTGKDNTLFGRVWIDGTQYRFLGHYGDDNKADFLEDVSVDIDAFSTIVTAKTDAVRLTARFTSPLLIEDLYYVSRPVAYCHVSYESLDGQAHDVRVKFTCGEDFVLNHRDDGRAIAEAVAIPGLSAVRMGKGNQKVLGRSGDDIRIDWGHLYVATVGEGTVGAEIVGLNAQGGYTDLYSVYAEKTLSPDALFLFAYDDIQSIQYFGENLEAYWKKDGKTIQQALVEAAADYSAILEKCTAFSEKLKKQAEEKGSVRYAELLLLTYRQVMAAHKLVLDREGNLLYISKECDSNGCAATVDVTYPSAPLFLLYNPELLKGMLRPVMKYSATEEWNVDFAPHDLGVYPLLNGQVYWVDRGEKTVIKKEGQMPVEECGNMIILFAAICEKEKTPAFAAAHMETLSMWCKYLVQYGLDPENQLCTDDFAGRLSHNVNLAIKAIMGIAGYAKLLKMLDRDAEAEKMMETAREYAASLLERAANTDGSYRLTFDRPETFSLKYNAIWDLVWQTELFPAEFFAGEIARYKKELLPYGVPLDSREKYTKSDWLVWAASFANNEEDFALLTDALWNAYNTMRTRVPMGDWFYCDTSEAIHMFHRSVQGGLFMKLLLEENRAK